MRTREVYRRLKVAIVANEFFDPNIGRMGGFGWIAREVAIVLRESVDSCVEVVFLAGESAADGMDGETISSDTRLMWNSSSHGSREYAKKLRREGIDVILSIDYRSSYRSAIRPLWRTPLLVWSQDPRPPSDIEKIETLMIPQGEGVRPDGIEQVSCRSLARIVRVSKWVRRRLVWATPLMDLQEKMEGTYGVRPVDLQSLPYPLRPHPGGAVKAKRPLVVFLGRLDPIKRPWIFLELARRIPTADFVFLGKAHFSGPGAWTPGEVPGNVSFKGHIDGAEKEEWLSRSWLLVNTSIHEALPVSFVEALGMEVPIVSCQNPGGIVARFGGFTGRHDGDGLASLDIFEGEIRALLQDDERRLRCGREGRSWVLENHTREVFLNRFWFLCGRVGLPVPPAGHAASSAPGDGGTPRVCEGTSSPRSILRH